MKIPDWAERAINAKKPTASAFSQDGKPNEDALTRWNAYSAQFRDQYQWNRLTVDKWSVSDGAAGERQKTSILMNALNCANAFGMGSDPLQSQKNHSTLLKLEEKISDLARELAKAIEAHEVIQESTPTNWGGDSLQRDPLDFLDALEMVMDPAPESNYARPSSPVCDELLSSLRKAQETSLPVPEWPALLGQLADRCPDNTRWTNGTNKSEFSPWCHKLIAMLNDSRVLHCLSDGQLAELANVTFRSHGQINMEAKQMASLKKKHPTFA